MKRKSLAICVLCAILTVCLVACGGNDDTTVGKELGGLIESGSKGLEYKLDISSQSYTVTGIGSCTDTDIVIPSIHNGRPVRAIAAGAFKVTGAEEASIRDSYFSLALDSTVSLGTGENPPHLTDKDEGHTGKIESVVIPDSITDIGDEAFMGCEKLESVEITKLVSLIGSDAFKDTAFYNDESNWDNGLLYLDNYLVGVKESFAGACEIREGIRFIADGVFENCKGLTAVSFPTSLRSVGKRAFYGCTALNEVDLAIAGIEIAEEAFASCTALTRVVIANDTPATLLTKEELEELPINVITPGSEENGMNAGSITFNRKAYYRSFDREGFVYSAVIGQKAFADCIALSDLTLGANVKMIGAYAFMNCTSLVEASLEKITVSADGLSDPIVHHTGLSFADTALTGMFTGCTSLTSVKLPEGLKILANTFKGCTSLTSVDLPDGIRNIRGLFEGCTSLKTVTLPESVLYLASAFDGCSSLEEITLPASLKKLEAYAFRGCSSLKAIDVPDSVTVIAESALALYAENCVITLGKGVKEIGLSALEGARELFYRGTAEEWEKISLHEEWDGSPEFTPTIHFAK